MTVDARPDKLRCYGVRVDLLGDLMACSPWCASCRIRLRSAVARPARRKAQRAGPAKPA